MSDFTEIIADNDSNYDSDEDSDTENVIEPTEIRDQWVWKTSDFNPQFHKYEINARPNIGSVDWEALNYFEYFIDGSFVNGIAAETNRYQEQNKILQREKMSDWVDTDGKEICIFLAIVILTGLLRKCEIEQYWSTDILLFTPIFG